jgi:hypothetical protein
MEGSTLCAEHRAQAALFARAVATEAPKSVGTRHQRVDWPERETFTKELAAAFARVVDASKAAQGHSYRYPEIAVYVLAGKLRARPYYTILGPGPRRGGFEVGSTLVSRELSPGGVLFETFAREVVAHREALEKGAVQSVSLELQGHNGVVALCERRGDSRKELLRLKLSTEGFIDSP